MVASTRRETRFWAGCDLPRIFIRAFEYGENWITNTINRYELCEQPNVSCTVGGEIYSRS